MGNVCLAEERGCRGGRQRLAVVSLLVSTSVAGIWAGCFGESVPDRERIAAASWPIQDGQVAPPHRFPFAAFVYLRTPNTPADRQLNCTGALVAPDLILTAAHCAVCLDRAEVTLLGQPGVTHTVRRSNGDVYTNPEAYGDDVAFCDTSDLDALGALELQDREPLGRGRGVAPNSPRREHKHDRAGEGDADAASWVQSSGRSLRKDRNHRRTGAHRVRNRSHAC